MTNVSPYVFSIVARSISLLTLAAVALLIVVTFAQDRKAAPGPVQGKPDLMAFERTVGPFLKKHCVSCHGGRNPKGDLRLDKLDANVLTGPDVDAWNTVRFKLVAQEMPPDGRPRPPHGPTQQVIKGAASASPCSGGAGTSSAGRTTC